MSQPNPRDRVAIVGMGAITSIGLYPEAIAAAVAGGISHIRTVETIRHATTGAAMRLALTSRAPVHASLRHRLVWLGGVAANQALAPLAPFPGLRGAVLLSMPREHAGLSGADIQRAAARVAYGLSLEAIDELCGSYSTGADGGVMCLGVARDMLRERRADICLVGGIDSYCDTGALEPLARAGRLKDEDTPAGIIPGEGAAFVLLMRSETAQRLALPELAYIVEVAAAPEPNPWYSKRSTQAQGLTQAIAGVFQGHPPTTIAHATYCDANGEHWRADEWSFAYLRTAERHADPLDIRHPADCWGDVGAASTPLLLVTAVVDHRRGRVRGPGILVWCASDMGPLRGAVLVEAQRGGA